MGEPILKDGETPKTRRAKRTRQLAITERVEKTKVRLRDRECRFPRCGCKRMQLGLTGGGMTNTLLAKCDLVVSHDVHKGMGGDPTGAVSIAPLMILLCRWRHQDAPVSVHAGTLRTLYLTPDQNDGPLAFEIDLRVLMTGTQPAHPQWFEVGREVYDPAGAIVLGPLTLEQEAVLLKLSEMRR